MKKFVLSIFAAVAVFALSISAFAATGGNTGGGAVGDMADGIGGAIDEVVDGVGEAFDDDSGMYNADEFGDEDNRDGNVDDFSEDDVINKDRAPETTKKTPQVLGAADQNPSTGAGFELFGLAAAGTIMLGTTALARRNKH